MRNIKNDISKLLKYPKKYKYKNEDKNSYTIAFFTINNNGIVSDLKINTCFQNKENNKYLKYFEKKLKNFIIKSKWIPGKIYGMNVNTGMQIGITYK